MKLNVAYLLSPVLFEYTPAVFDWISKLMRVKILNLTYRVQL